MTHTTLRARHPAPGLFALALGLGTVLAWLFLDPLDPLFFARTVAGHSLAPAVFVGVQVLAGLLFVPRTVTGIAAGLIFGQRWGFVWLMLGTIIGSAVGFALARAIRPNGVKPQALPRLGPLLARAGTWGWPSVAALRLVPGIPYSATNYALGLTRVRFDRYLLGSLIGQIPSTIIYAVVGGSGGDLLQGRASWLTTGVDAALLLALCLVVALTLHRRPQHADQRTTQIF